MPISGGTPTRIAEGMAWEVQPRFSPDGRRIAFTSDRGGGDNIWVMNADGSDKRQVTKEDFRLVYQPSWSPGGQYIAAKKHFTTQRSLGTGEIWLYHVSGGGGAPLVKRPNEQHQKELGEPVFAPDKGNGGGKVYYTRNISPGPIFEYAQDAQLDLFNIEAVDIATGEISTVASGPGGAVRPQPSPDGKSLAFIKREGTHSSLYVKDLASGVETRVVSGLDIDMQEGWAVTGVYPNFAWMPDNRGLVYWAKGKLNRVNRDGSGASVIPFHVADTRAAVASLHPTVDVAPDRFPTKMVRFASESPDGRSILFESLGKLWLKPASGGAARRLTRDKDGARELFPSWSRDGKSIAYVRWTDDRLGEIRVVGPSGSGRTVTSNPGLYARPAFSPDGRTLVFEQRQGGGLTSGDWSENAGIYRVAVSGGEAVRISASGSMPHFGAANDRIFLNSSGGGKQQLVSVDLNGEAKRVHGSGELSTDYRVSPDGRWLAFRQNYETWVMPLMAGPQDVSIDSKSTALPVVRASRGGAEYAGWSADSSRIGWSVGPQYYAASLASMMTDPAKFQQPTSGVSLSMEVAADKPTGTLALTGARLVTMSAADGGIIDNGVIVVQGDRILAVGPAGTAIPAGATRIDVSGKTIIPGLIDAHAHGPIGTGDLIPQQNWVQVQALALGTTTIHDPSNRSTEVFAAQEYQRSGSFLAPRIFSTGEVVYGAKSARVYAEINSLDDALAHVRRLKAQGSQSVKNYNQPRREQRQQVAEAARREGMQVVAEGGSLFGLDMTIIADGNATLEHNIPMQRFYADMIDFFAASGTNYTPTLVVSFGGMDGDKYWRQATDMFDQPLLKQHTPPGVLAESLRRVKAPDQLFYDGINAREAKRLAERGVLVSIGAHGQQPGIAAHWELWSFVKGGMTPLQALQAGTIVPAKSLGMAKDIGSLEAGKLADLVVIDADPTADIRNSEKVAQVMLGGRLYDSATMNEVAPAQVTRPPHWWVSGGRYNRETAAAESVGHVH
ncbi:amidohydrolase family protein [Sandaracinobacteroides hominis]|uniref:amidohydrolase family protein n=1 Tax=Sandaracinobacteroides hominis TaxID=2780086 RepID=UPI002E2854B3|nr:amidohydrolase family protein [Sandaracinobacteroides hominis]